jgi:hypothetical protein
MGHKTCKENICRKLKETKEWMKKSKRSVKLTITHKYKI